MLQKPDKTAAKDAAERLAIEALGFLAQDGERLGRFLTLTGLGPADLRQAASSATFLVGVLDHVLEDEPLLLSFAANVGIEPGHVMRARSVLAPIWERDIP